MFFKKFLLIFLIIICIVQFQSIAQTSNYDKLRDFYLKEKIKIKPEDLLKMLKKNNRKADTSKIQSLEQSSTPLGLTITDDSEIVVSNAPEPESEISAAMNPTDTNNIVISPIQLSPNYLQALLCPIYYTKDFGKTWSTSSFKNLPLKSDAYVIAGGDPVLSFNTQGKLYFSWINVYVTIIGQTIDSLFKSILWAYSTDGGNDWQRESKGTITYLADK